MLWNTDVEACCFKFQTSTSGRQRVRRTVNYTVKLVREQHMGISPHSGSCPPIQLQYHVLRHIPSRQPFWSSNMSTLKLAIDVKLPLRLKQYQTI
jgi:hypothetical protein